MIQCADTQTEKDILNASLRVKPDGLFTSELLPGEVNSVFFKLRNIKRVSKNIAKLYTKDRVIIAKKTDTGKTYHIRTQWDMEKFLHESGLANHM